MHEEARKDEVKMGSAGSDWSMPYDVCSAADWRRRNNL